MRRKHAMSEDSIVPPKHHTPPEDSIVPPKHDIPDNHRRNERRESYTTRVVFSVDNSYITNVVS
jgi:hypothetical protein